MKFEPTKWAQAILKIPQIVKMVELTTKEREASDFSSGLSPSKVASMIEAANGGDIKDQCRISIEIEEKNWTIAQAMNTRRNAVTGTEWRIVPADSSDKAKEIADALESALISAGNGMDLDNFNDLIYDLSMAVLPGVSASEIVWQDAGKSFAGFVHIPSTSLNFKKGVVPTIITEDNAEGEEIPENKVILHRLRRNGNDPIRGGLIRVLAWLHCFQNANTKWKMSFIEKFGIPYVLLSVSDKQFESELRKYQQIAANFGANGSAVVTDGTKMEMIQASNTTGDVFFKLDEYLDRVIEKIIIGQNASSGQSSGLSGGDAQSAVRDDIRRADCTAIASTINSQLVRPWFTFNYGTDTAFLPQFEFILDLDDEKLNAEISKTKIESISTAINAGALTPSVAVEGVVREILGIPELTPDEEKIQKQIIENKLSQNQPSAPVSLSDYSPAVQLANQRMNLDEAVMSKMEKEGAFKDVFDPVIEAIQQLGKITDESKFKEEIEKFSKNIPFGSTEKLESGVESAMASAYTVGVLKRAAQVGKIKGGNQ